MSKITKESFRYFKGIYELHCGWIVDDEYYDDEKICSKRSTLMQVRTKSEDKSFQRNMRALKIQKGIYPTGMSFEEALENEEIKKYYETGRYKKGSFVAKCIVPLNCL